MPRVRLLSFIAVLGFGACGAPEAADEVGSDEEALTSVFTYDCHRLHVAGTAVRLHVTKKKTRLTVIDANQVDAFLDGLNDLYAAYNPRKARYAGRIEFRTDEWP